MTTAINVEVKSTNAQRSVELEIPFTIKIDDLLNCVRNVSLLPMSLDSKKLELKFKG